MFYPYIPFSKVEHISVFIAYRIHLEVMVVIKIYLHIVYALLIVIVQILVRCVQLT
jgi:hypothetical protein